MMVMVKEMAMKIKLQVVFSVYSRATRPCGGASEYSNKKNMKTTS